MFVLLNPAWVNICKWFYFFFILTCLCASVTNSCDTHSLMCMLQDNWYKLKISSKADKTHGALDTQSNRLGLIGPRHRCEWRKCWLQHQLLSRLVYMPDSWATFHTLWTFVHLVDSDLWNEMVWHIRATHRHISSHFPHPEPIYILASITPCDTYSRYA